MDYILFARPEEKWRSQRFILTTFPINKFLTNVTVEKEVINEKKVAGHFHRYEKKIQ